MLQTPRDLESQASTLTPNAYGTGAPLDLGLSIFIAAGIGYTASKRKDKKWSRAADDLAKDYGSAKCLFVCHLFIIF